MAPCRSYRPAELGTGTAQQTGGTHMHSRGCPTSLLQYCSLLAPSMRPVTELLPPSHTPPQSSSRILKCPGAKHVLAASSAPFQKPWLEAALTRFPLYSSVTRWGRSCAHDALGSWSAHFRPELYASCDGPFG
ncbi:hypothetical protein KIL84_009302 [Mauremys mutica]|uniref:Uncharacterized protein n=1 Tax=Mauremys mutica TaxID=74926 RepID=A0A9D4B4R5_9SAUR|nr:hypothetical protein KIL84_009302 [Mauremys mutica]